MWLPHRSETLRAVVMQDHWGPQAEIKFVRPPFPIQNLFFKIIVR